MKLINQKSYIKNKLSSLFFKTYNISENKFLMKLKNIIPICLLSIGALVLPQPSNAEEKIEVLPIIQSSKGLSGKNFNYLEGKPELRLLK